ncbi:hypothetical protein B0E53_06208 [Micromonospora sp. MH33]|nr:hypothetical protein B0E53_06208 [Micromonospora sp. MH33]
MRAQPRGGRRPGRWPARRVRSGQRRQDQPEERHRDRPVEPVVVAGADHHQQGHGRVGEPQPPPPPGGDRHQRDGDGHGPADVQRGHRGVLVAQRVGLGRAVDGGAVPAAGVHQAGERGHPGRGERDEDVQGQRRGGERGERPPHPPVVRGMAEVEPDQAQHGGREVHVRVVAVGQPDRQLVDEQRRLHGHLVRQVQQPLEPPDPLPVHLRVGGPPGHRQPTRLVREEEHGDEGQLADRPAHRPGRPCVDGHRRGRRGLRRVHSASIRSRPAYAGPGGHGPGPPPESATALGRRGVSGGRVRPGP